MCYFENKAIFYEFLCFSIKGDEKNMDPKSPDDIGKP